MQPIVERELGTGELFRHAVEEAKLLARAEFLHAKEELREEVLKARGAGTLLGIGITLVLCALAGLLVALGLVLPLGPAAGVAVVAVVALAAGAIVGFLGYKRLPKEPLRHTRARLLDDVKKTREVLS